MILLNQRPFLGSPHPLVAPWVLVDSCYQESSVDTLFYCKVLTQYFNRPPLQNNIHRPIKNNWQLPIFYNWMEIVTLFQNNPISIGEISFTLLNKSLTLWSDMVSICNYAYLYDSYQFLGISRSQCMFQVSCGYVASKSCQQKLFIWWISCMDG